MTEPRSHTPSAPHVPSEKIRELVNDRSAVLGLTRERVARAGGVGRSTLFDWLSGTGQPSAAGWRGLASALEISVCEMFESVGVASPSPVELARLERGWTRGDLADEAHVSFATVRALEDGGQVRPDAAARVGRALGMRLEFISSRGRVSARATTPLGQAIEKERLNRGWTIAQLGRHLGTARQLVSAWLLGSEPVAARWLPALAEFTQIPLAEVERLSKSSRDSSCPAPGRAAVLQP